MKPFSKVLIILTLIAVTLELFAPTFAQSVKHHDHDANFQASFTTAHAEFSTGCGCDLHVFCEAPGHCHIGYVPVLRTGYPSIVISNRNFTRPFDHAMPASPSVALFKRPPIA